MDECHSYGFDDLPLWFTKKNMDILKQPKGAGWWIWKPYIIYHALTHRLNEGDVLMYMDSGTHLIDSVDPLVDYFLKTTTKDVLSFELDHKEQKYTKRDTFVILGADNEDRYINSDQRLATFILIRKSEASLNFIQSWLTYVQDRRALSPEASVLGSDYPEFISHRHDQSIFSLLCKKWNIPFIPDLSQWGNEKREEWIKQGHPSPTGQIVDHTRDRS